MHSPLPPFPIEHSHARRPLLLSCIRVLAYYYTCLPHITAAGVPSAKTVRQSHPHSALCARRGPLCQRQLEQRQHEVRAPLQLLNPNPNPNPNTNSRIRRHIHITYGRTHTIAHTAHIWHECAATGARRAEGRHRSPTTVQMTVTIASDRLNQRIARGVSVLVPFRLYDR